MSNVSSTNNKQYTRPIIGESKPVLELIKMIERVAPTKTNILVIGESGTGKELVARMIHEAGPLRGKPFVPVNCGAIPETLIESEMFGHKKGSFTGAVNEKAGLFEAANGGTLFLDEVGELPLSMQVKLLRAIQERSFRKVGGNEDVKVDVRIIAATNRDLEAAIAKNTFREDLYYRLNVIMIKTPPLRERKSDLPILIDYFLKRYAEKQKKDIQAFDEEAMMYLTRFPWPGNIRELENVIERAVTLSNAGVIPASVLPTQITQSVPIGGTAGSGSSKATNGSSSPSVGMSVDQVTLPAPDFSKGSIDLEKILGEVEKIYMTRALEHTKGVKKKAADLLGITFRSIRYRLKKLGMDAGADAEGDEGEGEESEGRVD